ncbi:MAG: hypothetical protein C0467_17880 [Planctomycetaceae bacterium]|nr:hypothetical protein [Planctomycetaceae bacterium]
MSQMSENTAEKLDQTQAAELVRVIDLQARWENMRGNPATGGGSGFSTPDLQGRQKAYEAFRVRLAAYTTRYRASHVPEVTLNTPERVGMWCRAVRAVFRRAGQEFTEYPTHTVAKAHRLADRIATRLGRPPAEREESSPGLAGAIRNLDAIVSWCEQMSAPTILLSGLRVIPAVGAEVRSEAA